MLVEIGIVSILIFILSAFSVYNLRQEFSNKLALMTLLFGPSIDGVLSYFIARLLDINPASSVIIGISFGIISLILLQPLLISSRLVIWRLAWNNVVRQKRQTALLISGLMIASSVITSSLVIGDSLDDTISWQVEEIWQDTDIVIQGIDPFTGSRVVFSENFVDEIWNEITASDLQNKPVSYQSGLIQSGAVSADSGRALPAIALVSMNASLESQFDYPPLSVDPSLTYFDLEEERRFTGEDAVAITTELSEELEVDVGEEIRIKWFFIEDNQRKSRFLNFTVSDIVSPQYGAAFAGVQSAAVFMPLSTMQSAFGMESKVNILRFTLESELTSVADAEIAKEEILQIADSSWTAKDSGYVFTKADGTASISVGNEQGLGRISAEIVNSSRSEFLMNYESVSMMEVIQVPLAELVHEQNSILSLGDQDITHIHRSDEFEDSKLWHFGQAGFGYEYGINTDKDFFSYVIDEGKLLEDFYLSSGSSIIFSDGESIMGHSSIIGDEVVEIYSSEDEILEVIGISNSLNTKVIALEYDSSEDEISLLEFEEFRFSNLPEDFNFTNLKLDINLPSRIISSELNPISKFEASSMIMELEGLTSVEYFEMNLSNSDLQVITATQDSFNRSINSEFGEVAYGYYSLDTSVAENQDCDGEAYGLSLNFAKYWCSTDYGMVEFDEFGSTNTMRFGIFSEVDGAGRIGQMLLSVTDGSGQNIVNQSQILSNQRLGQLLSNQDNNISVVGLIPYALGNDETTQLEYAGNMGDGYGLEGLSELDGITLGLVSISDAVNLTSSAQQERSILIYNGGDVDDGSSSVNQSFYDDLVSWYDGLVGIEDSYLRVSSPKVETMEEVEASSGVISGTFLIFGGFIMAAGFLLIITITSMLAQARKSDFALLRIFGLKRRDISAFVMMEGVLASFFAGLFGSLLGLLMAFFVADGFQEMYSDIGVEVFRFSWEIESVISGWFGGFLVACSVMLLTSIWSSRLIIVEALRGIKTTLDTSVPWWVILACIFGLMSAMASLGMFVIVGLESGLAYLAWMIFGISSIIFIIPFLLWIIPALMRNRIDSNSSLSKLFSSLYRERAKNTFSTLGVALLVWCSWPSSASLVRKQLTSDELSMLVLGLIQVASGVLILTSLAPIVAHRISRSKSFTNLFGASLPVGLSHPKENPFRTALIIGMFSITVFSVVVLSGYTMQFDEYSSNLISDAEGEYEIILTSSVSRPIDISTNPDDWPTQSEYIGSIDSVGVIYTSTVFISEEGGDNIPYILRGVDYEFSSHAGLPLYAWDEVLGDTEREAWMAMQSSEHIAFVDASFGLELITDQSGIGEISLELGDYLEITDPQNPSNTKTVQIGGFLEQSSMAFSPGIFVGESIGKEQFGGEITRMYVSVGNDLDYDLDRNCCDDIPTPPGKSQDVRLVAGLLANDLSTDLSAEGINAETTTEDVLEVQGLVVSLLSIFESYLLLGLIVGTAGIGVVTLRSVSERTSQTGMLRAIGFTRNQVISIYLVEIYWICILGMLNGAAIAIGFHLSLFNSVWSEQGAELSLPIFQSLNVIILGLLMATVAVFVPVNRASKIPPAAALRSN